MRNFGLALVMGLLSLSGCVVTTDAGSDTYERCDFTSDCNFIEDTCFSITADWPDRTTTDSICTSGCFDSSDCPISNNGNLGLCVDFGGSGTRCYETCVFNSDCDPGFNCGDFGFAESVCLPY